MWQKGVLTDCKTLAGICIITPLLCRKQGVYRLQHPGLSLRSEKPKNGCSDAKETEGLGVPLASSGYAAFCTLSLNANLQ